MLDHNPTIIDPSQIIKENCKSLALLDKITSGKKKIPKIITARRQPMNLLRILSLSIKRDHKLTKSNTGNFEKCKDARCLACQQVIVSSTYKTKNGQIIKRNANLNCKSKDLLYLLICDKCKEEYNGETGIQLNLRTNLHRNQIKKKIYRKLKVSKHIHKCGKNKFSVFPFQKCYKNCHIYREEMEKNYRKIIKPTLH